MGAKDGVYGLYVSRPGFDVHTATAQQLAFDSRLGHYGSVIASGVTTRNTYIYFPEMPYVPLVYTYGYQGDIHLGDALFQRTDFTGNGQEGKMSTNWSSIINSYRVTKTYLHIRGGGYPPVNNQNPDAVSVRYIIWRAYGGYNP